MAKGVYFGLLHSNADLHLILQKTEIAPALPKTSFVNLPAANGSIDLTEALGKINYSDRKLKFTFATYPGEDWEAKKTAVSNAISGRRMDIRLDDDPGYVYTGRVSVTNHATDGLLKTITVEAICQPYKHTTEATTVTASLSVSGAYVTSSLPAGAERVIPTVTAGQDTELLFGGKTFTVRKGESRPVDLALENGANSVRARLASTKLRITRLAGRTYADAQAFDPEYPSSTTHNGITYTADASGYITCNGTASGNSYFNLSPTSGHLIKTGHKYALLGMENSSYVTCKIYKTGTSQLFSFSNNEIFTVDADLNQDATYTATWARLQIASGRAVSNVVVHPYLIDLTHKFGPGREPTSFDDPRINPTVDWDYNGTALSEVSPYWVRVTPDEGEPVNADVTAVTDLDGFNLSAGTVFNDADLAAGVYHHRVGSVRLADLSWYRQTQDYGHPYFRATYASSNLIGIKPGTRNILCGKYCPRSVASSFTNFATGAQYDEMAINASSTVIMIRDDRYTTAESFRAALGDTELLYELEFPYDERIDIAPIEAEAAPGAQVTMISAYNGIWGYTPLGFAVGFDFLDYSFDSGNDSAYTTDLPAASAYAPSITYSYTRGDL